MGAVGARPVRTLRWARVDPTLPGGLHVPKRGGDVGWDLEAMEDVVIPPMRAADVPVNARLELPEGTWGAMMARSSIAKLHLQVEAGIIDNGYRGPLFVVLRNMQLPARMESMTVDERPEEWDLNAVTIKRGQRVAQLIFYRMCPVWGQEVEEIDVATDRGEAGFGSTGTGLEEAA